jgi:hypothetical protein
MTMPGRKDRNANDEREVQQRKAEIEAIPQEELLKMADQHEYGKGDDD